jgi:hypothetical protein
MCLADESFESVWLACYLLLKTKSLILKYLSKSHTTHLPKNTATPNVSNLTPIQSKALHSLKQNKQLVIKPTDKNLGPAIMDLDAYILQTLREHLLTEDYIQLSKKEALT